MDKVVNTNKNNAEEKNSEKPALDKKVLKKRILKILLIIVALVGCYFIYSFINKQVSNTFYYVVFDTDGGSRIDTIKVRLNEVATKPEDPKKEGYKFKYWTLDNVEYDFNTKVRNNTILTAIWEVDDKAETKEVNKDKEVVTGENNN